MSFLKKEQKKSNKFKILLIIIIQPLSKHLIKQYGVKTKYKNWKIIYWNILSFLKKENKSNFSRRGHRLKKHKNFKNIESFSSLFKEYKKLPEKFFFWSNVPGYFFTAFLEKFLKLSGGTKVLIDYGTVIDFKVKYLNVFKFLIKDEKLYLIKKIIFFILGKIKNIFTLRILYTKPEILFAGNYRTYLEFIKKYKGKKVYKINSPDFDTFLKIKKRKKKKKNIIFLDQDRDYNFDYQMRDFLNTKFEVKDYWNNLNNIFKKISKIFPKNNFLIAAHHRKNKNKLPIKENFVFDKTSKLIKDAKLVLTHNSMAISFAVLFRKPLVLINFETFNLQAFEITETLKSYSKVLGAKVINIKKNSKSNFDKLNFKSGLKVNNKKYEKYENFYIGFPGLKSQGNMWKKILISLENEYENYCKIRY
tara:strand:- start:192 stop:1448 length:1257 start_codon:yes stop_codon:yes gene_type:complete